MSLRASPQTGVAISSIAISIITGPVDMVYLEIFNVNLYFLRYYCPVGDCHVGLSDLLAMTKLVDR